jgi:asparagine synthetase B (glutamine-hydrolysing)
MCGFVYSNFKIEDLFLTDITSRGPDDEKTIANELGYFYQSRLITNSNTNVCPAENNHGVLLYNGTEYDLDNDTDFILTNLSDSIEKNLQFLQTLNGDFAICFVTDQYIFLATDAFITKPLYYGIWDSNICVASTPTPIEHAGLNPHLLEQNTLMVFERSTAKFINKFTIHHFNLYQHKDNLEDILIAFEKSVLDRFEENALINLSSGYDSGAIVACLKKHNKKFQNLIYFENENLEILKERIRIDKNKKHYLYKESLLEDDGKIFDKNAPTDNLILRKLALTTAKISKNNNCRVNLTGTGSDEHYSDYGFFGKKLNSESIFGGFFPQQLETIFPWYTNNAYSLHNDLRTVDYYNGLHGIDSRHPFLDKNLFQTWLNSKNKIKNYSYKHWIEQYLIQTKYPFAHEKIGIGCKTAINII